MKWNKIKKFAFGFVVAFLLVLSVFALCANAQEQRLKPVYTENCDTSIIPSPELGSGEYMIAYDCKIPANTTVPVNVYGIIYPGSNLYLCAIYDEPYEGFAHRVAATMMPTIIASEVTQYVKWGFDVKHIALLRLSQTSSSNYGNVSTPQNGLPVTVDSVTIGMRKQSLFALPYSRAVIRRNDRGQKIITVK